LIALAPSESVASTARGWDPTSVVVVSHLNWNQPLAETVRGDPIGIPSRKKITVTPSPSLSKAVPISGTVVPARAIAGGGTKKPKGGELELPVTVTVRVPRMMLSPFESVTRIPRVWGPGGMVSVSHP